MLANQPQRFVLALLGIFGALWLSACATVNPQHPEVETRADAPTAMVYVIRPSVLKTKGFADNPVRVEFQGKPLAKLSEGSYILVRLKPSEGLVRVNSLTRFTNQSQPIEVWRERRYKFIPGYTYFIHLRQLNEEFRGVYYEPAPVDWDRAKELIKDARATGDARAAPIDKLTGVVAPPSSTIDHSNPALPENLYKPEQYLRGKPQ